MSNKSKHENGLILLLIFTTLLIFVYKMFPSLLDFYFINLSSVINADVSGTFDTSSSGFIGNQILFLIISKICDISFNELITLPLLLVPFILLFCAIVRHNYKRKFIYILLAASFFIPINYPANFELSIHETAMIIFCVAILILILFEKNKINSLNVTIILTLTLISITYCSYKISFLLLFFLIFLELIILFELYSYKKIKEITILPYLILIGLPLVLILNQFFYSTAFPFSNDVISDPTFLLNLGFQKISIIGIKSANILSNFFYNPPGSIPIIGTIRMLIVSVVFLVFLIVLIRLVKNKIPFTFNQKVIFALFLSSCLILLVYTILGLFDITYLVISMFFGVGLVFSQSKKLEKIVTIAIILIFSLSLIYTSIIFEKNYYYGHKETENLEYLSSLTPIINNLKSCTILTDVYSYGYINNNIIKGKHYIQSISPLDYLTEDDMKVLFLNQKNERQTNTYYILNAKQNYFILRNWLHFKSWSNYHQKISRNEELNFIYNSNYVIIYKN